MFSIMLVSDKENELILVQKALGTAYSLSTVDSSKSALTRLSKGSTTPDIIILDVQMPNINGFEMITRIRTSEKTKNVPVMFISSDVESATELEAYRLGAVDFIRRPLVEEILRKRVDLQVETLEHKKNVESQLEGLKQTASFYAQNAMRLEYFIIGVVSDLVADKDKYTGMHVMCTSKYFEILLREMLVSGVNYGIDAGDFELIVLSSRIHDMGKIGVPDSILQKTGKYSDDEFRQMQMHTVLAAASIQKYAYLLNNNKFLTYTYQMARSHHERFDGKGYPDGLSGQNIPILARILAVADTYEALTAERSYKQAMSHEQAYNLITQEAGVQFDPQVVATFQRVHEDIAQAAIQLKNQAKTQGL